MNDCIIFISGYGDTTSTLVGQVSSEDVPYVCIADLPDNPRVRSEFLFPPIIGQLCHTMKLFFIYLHFLRQYVQIKRKFTEFQANKDKIKTSRPHQSDIKPYQ